MIELNTFGPPNGRIISITLEEMELGYQVNSIDLLNIAQFQPDFSKICPDNKISTLFDHDTGIFLMRAGAILHYLATKTAMFLPKVAHHRWQTLEWMHGQLGGFGSMPGQAHDVLHNVLRWYKSIAAHPAVQQGYGIPLEASIPQP